MNDFKHGWHLDKRVNLSLIVTVIVAIASFSMFSANLASKVQENSNDISSIIQTQKEMRDVSSTQSNQLSTLITQNEGLRRDMQRIIGILDNIEN